MWFYFVSGSDGISCQYNFYEEVFFTVFHCNDLKKQIIVDTLDLYFLSLPLSSFLMLQWFYHKGGIYFGYKHNDSKFNSIYIL